MRTRPILMATAGLALAAALTGCASTSDGTATAPSSPTAGAGMMNGAASVSPGSDTDIAFAQLMIPHHQQAIQMADLAATNATSAEVKALAAQIKAAQDPEISMMSQWLAGWGAPIEMEGTTDGGMDHGDMDMGGMNVAGMMSAQEMDNLGAAAGADFDTMWLQMMTAHHQGAIAMAQQVADTTTNPAVQELADAIIAGQTTEITTMQQLLAK
ncbi:MAG: DUF305 domain-containing protein [Candidatus Nanopelagicales bacterium]